jgi:hypothetical protein
MLSDTVSDMVPAYHRFSVASATRPQRFYLSFLLLFPGTTRAFFVPSSRISDLSSSFGQVGQVSTPLLFSKTNGETELGEEHSTSPTSASLKQLQDQLDNCQSGTAARRVIESNFVQSALYNSVTIPPDSSAKGMSDGDLAIMTRIRNRKYGIMDLIELNGDRDADRASLAVLSVFMASTISALLANQSLPGP